VLVKSVTYPVILSEFNISNIIYFLQRTSSRICTK